MNNCATAAAAVAASLAAKASGSAGLATTCPSQQTQPVVSQSSPLSTVKDSFWLQLEVCREFRRARCSRTADECKFAHPPANVDVQPNGRVVACYDSIRGRCARQSCKYLHPPAHLRDQLLVNGRNHLALKNAFLQQQQQQISERQHSRQHQASPNELLLAQFVRQQQQQQHQQGPHQFSHRQLLQTVQQSTQQETMSSQQSTAAAALASAIASQLIALEKQTNGNQLQQPPKKLTDCLTSPVNACIQKTTSPQPPPSPLSVAAQKQFYLYGYMPLDYCALMTAAATNRTSLAGHALYAETQPPSVATYYQQLLAREHLAAAAAAASLAAVNASQQNVRQASSNSCEVSLANDKKTTTSIGSASSSSASDTTYDELSKELLERNNLDDTKRRLNQREENSSPNSQSDLSTQTICNDSNENVIGEQQENEKTISTQSVSKIIFKRSYEANGFENENKKKRSLHEDCNDKKVYAEKKAKH